MFYCDPCAKKRGWPLTSFKSVGSCELCGEPGECNDTPSADLPGVKSFARLSKEDLAASPEAVVISDMILRAADADLSDHQRVSVAGSVALSLVAQCKNPTMTFRALMAVLDRGGMAMLAQHGEMMATFAGERIKDELERVLAEHSAPSKEAEPSALPEGEENIFAVLELPPNIATVALELNETLAKSKRDHKLDVAEAMSAGLSMMVLLAYAATRPGQLDVLLTTCKEHLAIQFDHAISVAPRLEKIRKRMFEGRDRMRREGKL